MIDDIDKKIVEILQENARISNAEIARRIGMTTSGVFERVKKLERKRIVAGYKAVIDPKALGMQLLAFVFVRIRPTKGVRETGRRIAEMPGVQEVFHLAGEESLLCKVRCKDMKFLEMLLDRVNNIETVVATRTTLAFRAIKETSEMPAQMDASAFEPLSMENAAVEPSGGFEKTYRHYLDQIADRNLDKIADHLGLEREGEELMIPLFDTLYRVSTRGVLGPSGDRPHPAVSGVLFKYILSGPHEDQAEGRWVSFREFKDAAPFAGAFAYNAEKAISRQFAGNLDALEKACHQLGGGPAEIDLPYQFTWRFNALPRVPVLLLFNDEDEEFKTKSTVLFKENADHYLDVEYLGIVGWILADGLKRAKGRL
jgi:DNA-binding Lrp family transcriptional regulator